MAQPLEPKRSQPPDPAHYAESSARENLIEHVFLGELLRGLWCKNVRDLEVLRPEVDSGGYDLALEFRGLTRHVQLKSSYRGAQRADVTASVKLLERPLCLVAERRILAQRKPADDRPGVPVGNLIRLASEAESRNVSIL
jgi:hypothetical protein